MTAGVLTDAGWPRPRVDGYPVPWVAPSDALGSVNEGRRLASMGGGVCQVCGLGFQVGDYAYGFTYLPPGRRLGPIEPGMYLSSIVHESVRIGLIDGGVLHHKCARLTAAVCPHLRDDERAEFVRVPANDADPRNDVDGIMRPTYLAGDVELLAWPVPRRSS